MALQDRGNQHRETLAYYATFLSDMWHKPQKLSEWCGIRSSFWIMIHRKSMEVFIFTGIKEDSFMCLKVKEKASEQDYRIKISGGKDRHGKNIRQPYPS